MLLAWEYELSISLPLIIMGVSSGSQDGNSAIKLISMYNEGLNFELNSIKMSKGDHKQHGLKT